MTAGPQLVDAFTARRESDATSLVFEYMAATLAEAGRAPPAGIDQLPPVLRDECQNLAAVYRLPGTLLVAYRDEEPIGCVGLAPDLLGLTAEVKRLYVRPTHRKAGIGHILMLHAHRHAAQHGLRQLILDVLPSRTHVIDFYRRLGYTDTDPYPPSHLWPWSTCSGRFSGNAG
jgi:ribosomal protein S18 acetylase RimI-like enzyme